MCGGEELPRFHDGQPPGLQELLKATAANDATTPHADWVSANAANQNMFHDFTHGGVEVALRRVGEDLVEPNTLRRNWSTWQDSESKRIFALATNS